MKIKLDYETSAGIREILEILMDDEQYIISLDQCLPSDQTVEKIYNNLEKAITKWKNKTLKEMGCS